MKFYSKLRKKSIILSYLSPESICETTLKQSYLYKKEI